MKLKRSARMRTRRRGRWLPKQPRLGARMCQGTFFFIHDNRMLAECAFYCLFPTFGYCIRSCGAGIQFYQPSDHSHILQGLYVRADDFGLFGSRCCPANCVGDDLLNVFVMEGRVAFVSGLEVKYVAKTTPEGYAASEYFAAVEPADEIGRASCRERV